MNNKKVLINIGTIGHVDHGKTTLSSAITKYCAQHFKNPNNAYVTLDNIDSNPDEKKRGITIASAHLSYETDVRRYAHTDCPGHADFIKNMIIGSSQLDVAIVVISAESGMEAQTREHINLVKRLGIKKIIIFANKMDIADPENAEFLKSEIEDFLEKDNLYNIKDTPIIYGSALCYLKDIKPEFGESKIKELLEVCDTCIEDPIREDKSPIFFPIANMGQIKGRGSVAIGILKRGVISAGLELEVLGNKTEGEFKTHNQDANKKVTLVEVQADHKKLEKATAGENIGILLRGIVKDELTRGYCLCEINKYKEYLSLNAKIILANFENKNKGFRVGFQPQMFINTSNITCTIEKIFNENNDEVDKALPGDSSYNVQIKLHKTAVLEKGFQFLLREGSRTVAYGIVL